jgi:hypothetical protein
MQLIFEMQQLLSLAFHQLRNRHAGPSADHLGNVLFVHFFLQKPRTVGRHSDRASQLLLEFAKLAITHSRTC